MAKYPFMQVVVADIVADTTHMSPEEMGAYCRILFAMWLHGARLPAVDQELATIAGLSGLRWGKVRERVTRPLTFSNGYWTQKKMTERWERVQKLSMKRALAAKARWRR